MKFEKINTQVEKHQAVFVLVSFTNASILLIGGLTKDLFSNKFQPWPPSVIRPLDPVGVRQLVNAVFTALPEVCFSG